MGRWKHKVWRPDHGLRDGEPDSIVVIQCLQIRIAECVIYTFQPIQRKNNVIGFPIHLNLAAFVERFFILTCRLFFFFMTPSV